MVVRKCELFMFVVKTYWNEVNLLKLTTMVVSRDNLAHMVENGRFYSIFRVQLDLFLNFEALW